ncbi:hypothetical protein L2E82_01478 [Cichorium intybus]|uniref:Uncharacterized protein n=1 Tax=Cichorium intybus TaxID=13427 RepID=A0ACB9H0K0_CICIN|nr:hypothetical protein L2E82_01478 [Cichorium intybus]
MDTKEGVLMQRYELGKMVGHGNFAKVYHGRNLKTGVNVAIKIIDKSKVMKAGMVNQIKREISVTKLVKHPNIVHLHEVLASKTKIYFVLEYVKGGELFDKLIKGKLKEETARKYFRQLISAIGFCHSRGVYHRDLKPENLLLDDEGNLKVSDFGLSALAETRRQDGLLHTSCGTPAYVAPEVIDQKGYDGAKADIWSCGVVLFVLLAGFLPFHDSNLMEMYRKITMGKFKYPNSFPNEAKSLVSKILDPNPITRISIAEITEDSWFKTGLVCELPKRSEDMVSSLENQFDSFKGSFGEKIRDLTYQTEEIQGLEKDCVLNAFNIISLSWGFNLSGLFNHNAEDEREVRFMSGQPACSIVLKLEEIAKNWKLKVMKNNGVLLKVEGLEEGINDILAIDFEIYQITPNLHLIEAKRLGGDKYGFWEIVNEHVRPALIGVV